MKIFFKKVHKQIDIQFIRGILMINKVDDNKFSFLLVILLTLISTLIIYFRIIIQIEVGPIWDTFDFLSNAMFFAGQGFGYTDLTRPPLLPFLTSLFFSLGYISELPIFILEGLFYILGAVGLYFLLKIRFSSLESFMGSLLFATFPVVLFFTGLGLSDIPSVCFLIWAIYFTVLAVKKNSKLFYFSFLFAMLAFLTRYAAGLIIFPILIYIIINRKTINYWNVVVGIIISIIPLFLTLIFFFYTFDNPIYPFGSFYGSTQGSMPVLNYYYVPDFFYFVKNIPSYIGVAGITIIAFIILGILLLIFKGNKNLNKLRTIISRRNVNTVSITSFILFLIFILSLNRVPWILSELILFVLILRIYSVFSNLEYKFLDMDLLFLTWFVVFFVFHSVYVIKDDRYFLTMAPSLSYFLILGFNKISQSLDFKNLKLTRSFLTIFFVALMLISTFNYLPGIYEHEYLEKQAAEDSQISSQWLMNFDHNYRNKVIYADLGPYFSWYLRMNVKTMPVFMNGKRFGYQIKDYNITDKDLQNYDNELINNNASYYFSIRSGLNLTNYKLLREFGIISIYERN